MKLLEMRPTEKPFTSSSTVSRVVLSSSSSPSRSEGVHHRARDVAGLFEVLDEAAP